MDEQRDRPETAAVPVSPELPSALGNQAFSTLVAEGRVQRCGPGGAIVARAPAATEMANAADSAERAREGEQGQGPTSQVATLTTVSDVASAEKLRARIINRRWFLEQAMKEQAADTADGNVDDAKREANERAIVMLDRYLEDATQQRGALGSFQSQVANLELDHERLVAQIVAYAGTKQGKGTNDIADPEAVGRAQFKSTRVKAGEFRAATTSTRGGAVAGHQEATREELARMTELSQEVGTTHRDWRIAERATYAKAAALQSVVSAQDAKQVEGNIGALKAQAEAAKEQVAKIGAVVNGAVGIANSLVSGDYGDAAGTAIEVLFELAEDPAAAQFDAQIADLELKLKSIEAEGARAAIATAINELAVAKGELIKKAQLYLNANTNLERMQDNYRESMSEMGASADVVRGRGGRFEVLAQLLGEADAYLAQADATLAIGRQEQEAAKQVAGSVAPLAYEYGKEWISWWTVFPDFNEGRAWWYATEEPLVLHPIADDRVDATVDEAMQQLELIRGEVADHAATLRGAFNSRSGG